LKIITVDIATLIKQGKSAFNGLAKKWIKSRLEAVWKLLKLAVFATLLLFSKNCLMTQVL